MSLYSYVLFLHVCSALGLFMALALEGAVLWRLRSADSIELLRYLSCTFRRLRILYIPSFVGILATGLYLASQVGRGIAWIPVALGGTVVVLLVGGILSGRQNAQMKRALLRDGTADSFGRISRIAKSSVFVVSYGLRGGLAFGIVFLMTVKPEGRGSVLAMTVATITGLLGALLLRAGWDRTTERSVPREQT